MTEMSAPKAHMHPSLTHAGRPSTTSAVAVDEYGQQIEKSIACERPLTIYLNKREIVTLMTLGTHPELLTLGYLRNQDLVDDISLIESVQVDWEVNAVAVSAPGLNIDLEARLARRTVTTGCGQGTVFGHIMDKLAGIHVRPPRFGQSALYALLRNLAAYNETYKAAGGVHGCALCEGGEVRVFIEDVGRHNAVDAIAGRMWLEGSSGHDKVFYTTGRLTSEMVIKVAQMQIPILISRSGITEMGLDIARRVGVMLVSRAKGKHFLVFSAADRFDFDVELAPRSPRA